MRYAIAVIDIGMTNKKIAVYDDALNQLDAKYRVFEPLMINGLPCHDLDAMEEWFIAELKNLAARYPIRALAVSAHGATFVCVGKDGRNALPCVYYTYEPGDDFYRSFYGRFGKPEDLQERTGTPAFRAMINPAKGLFFAKEQFAAEFKNVSAALPYPQYWGLRFTGKTGVESTYIGNHTYLWDQIDNTLSSVARDLGVAPLIPVSTEDAQTAEGAKAGGNSSPLRKSWDILGTITPELAGRTGLPAETIVTMGIHDSNSALLPHFAKKGNSGFILNSTGTWCVIMNPATRYGFTREELGKVVFFNISAFGTPIKTAIFLGGLEYETWSGLIQKQHKRTDTPGWNENLYRSILGERRIFLLPEITRGSGQFPNSRARIIKEGKAYYYDDISASHSPSFPGYEESFAALRISLVMQTLTALERAGIQKGHELYTEGGFRRDEAYNRLLASALDGNRVFLTDVNEATALGAAMTAKMALSGKTLDDLAGDFEINYQEQEKGSFPELKAYRQAWLAEAEKKDCLTG
ncbi:MAG: FGGY-family carbohydrate kinase [Treponema sp.]|nr:FGGY-family carbohydrate kinase [Treponema sp.]